MLFEALLKSSPTLKEQKDIIPFFKKNTHLSLLVGCCAYKVRGTSVLAHEYAIYGDFIADMIVGNSFTQHYLLIEFEDASPNGIFKPKGKKSTPEWSPSIERAYSQLVDWIWKLEDMRHTSDFETAFGSRHAKFHGMIVSGKDVELSPQEQSRLRWRSDKTMIDSTSILCMSFDQIRDDLNYMLDIYYKV